MKSKDGRGRPKTIKGDTVTLGVILPAKDYTALEAIRDKERELGDKASSVGRLVREGVALLLKKRKL